MQQQRISSPPYANIFTMLSKFASLLLTDPLMVSSVCFTVNQKVV